MRRWRKRFENKLQIRFFPLNGGIVGAASTHFEARWRRRRRRKISSARLTHYICHFINHIRCFVCCFGRSSIRFSCRISVRSSSNNNSKTTSTSVFNINAKPSSSCREAETSAPAHCNVDGCDDDAKLNKAACAFVEELVTYTGDADLVNSACAVDFSGTGTEAFACTGKSSTNDYANDSVRVAHTCTPKVDNVGDLELVLGERALDCSSFRGLQIARPIGAEMVFARLGNVAHCGLGEEAVAVVNNRAVEYLAKFGVQSAIGRARMPGSNALLPNTQTCCPRAPLGALGVTADPGYLPVGPLGSPGEPFGVLEVVARGLPWEPLGTLKILGDPPWDPLGPRGNPCGILELLSVPGKLRIR